MTLDSFVDVIERYTQSVLASWTDILAQNSFDHKVGRDNIFPFKFILSIEKLKIGHDAVHIKNIALFQISIDRHNSFPLLSKLLELI